MKANQKANKKILVLGGIERVPYTRLSDNAEVSYIPQVQKMKNAEIASFDAVVCMTSELSHTMVKRVKKTACRYGVPLHFLKSSGATRFKCLLQEICGDSCPMRSFDSSEDKRLMNRGSRNL